MSREFRAALQRWRGRRAVQDRVEERGFRTHAVYQTWISDYCARKRCRSDIDVYWDERASEVIRSGVRVQSDRREFAGRPAYRSAYLDDLARSQENLADLGGRSLHPCVRAFDDENEADGYRLSKELLRFVDTEKRLEIAGIPFAAPDGRVTLRALHSLLERLSVEHQFEPTDVSNWEPQFLTRRGYTRAGPDGLIFFVGVERGAGLGGGQLPYRFFLRHRSPSEAHSVYLSDFRYVIPGFHYYGLFSDMPTAALGLRAMMTALEELSRSFF